MKGSSKCEVQAHQGGAGGGQARGGGAAGRRPGLPDGREAPEAGARGDAGVPEQRAEPAAGAAADGQPDRERRPDDTVQHLTSWIL
jgi:hypothetical protein